MGRTSRFTVRYRSEIDPSTLVLIGASSSLSSDKGSRLATCFLRRNRKTATPAARIGKAFYQPPGANAHYCRVLALLNSWHVCRLHVGCGRRDGACQMTCQTSVAPIIHVEPVGRNKLGERQEL